MTIKIYADGADLSTMRLMAGNPQIAGYTTNPTLARKAGVKHYLDFCRAALLEAEGKPVSLEVLSDDPDEIIRQAHILCSLSLNAVVKVPVINSRGLSLAPVIRELVRARMRLNVTAVFTESQVAVVGDALCLVDDEDSEPPIVSVFAGRIADAGVNPLEHVSACRRILSTTCLHAEMLWASPRQAYDVSLAERAGCEIITMSPDLIVKLALRGKDLTGYSRETVAMFSRDAQAAGFEL